MHTIELLLWDLPRCSQLLEIAPVFKTHQGSWDKVRLPCMNVEQGSTLLQTQSCRSVSVCFFHWNLFNFIEKVNITICVILIF